MVERHDDPFFESVRNELYSHEVTPPANAYGAIRQQLGGNSALFSLSAALVFVLGVSLAVYFAYSASDEAMAESARIEASSLDATLSTSQLRIEEREQALKPELQILDLSDLITRATSARQGESTNAAPAKVDGPNTVGNETAVIAEEIVETKAEVVEAPVTEEMHTPDHVDAQQSSTSTVAMPADWASRSGVNPNDILQQLDTDSDVIRMSIPVKVAVEDKD